MKRILLASLVMIATFAQADLNTVVSILPQKTFVEAIGGDKVNVTLMVKPGNSPHSYEPKPSQMRDIAKADIYFALDVEFEHTWLPKFKSQNNSMKIVDLDHGIQKSRLEKHSHHEKEHGHDDHEEHHDEHDDHEEGLDPHIWTSPSNVKIIATNIYNTLCSEDSANKDYYKSNYEKFLKHIKTTDQKIKTILKDVPKHSKFMVFHPAWGYFAAQYNLTQIAIEAGGKNPKPKHIAYLIEEAKEENIKAVFTAPEFSDTAARQIAKELGVPVIKVSPLNPKWSKNLQRLAKAIANKR
ncbi:MAG: zinc ABC transporter substrate-binding protein [Campylobacterota bacterium]|nr:zinc ABC transporter substrate-binding protein [Campylobacterota bacterium]